MACTSTARREGYWGKRIAEVVEEILG